MTRHQRMSIISLGLTLLLFTFCAKEQPKEKILAKIGNRSISVDEFKMRAEFAIRPQMFKKKEITFNNLLIEKMLAEEAGEVAELTNNENYQAYMKGLQEQKMRERLYYTEAVDKVSIDTAEVGKTFRLSMREYDLSFFSIHNYSIIKRIDERLDLDPNSALQIFDEMSQAVKPAAWTVKWKDPDPDPVHIALYSRLLDENEVIGPIKVENDNYLFMKVDTWRDKPIIGPEDSQLRIKEIYEKLTQIKSGQKWAQYMSDVMKGKKISFNKETFNQLLDFYQSMNNTKSDEEKKAVYQKYWEHEEGELSFGNLSDKEKLLNAPFFAIDGVEWTVNDFRNALMSHPLVYRQSDMARAPFRIRFRNAVVDLIRDQFLNEEAYKKNLDNSVEVKRNISMWKDAYKAYYYRNNIVSDAIKKGLVDKDDNNAKLKYWDDYMEGLKEKYKAEIEVDYDKLNKIDLTSIDLYVMQPGVPYITVVPGFPQFTTKSKLDYKKVEK